MDGDKSSSFDLRQAAMKMSSDFDWRNLSAADVESRATRMSYYAASPSPNAPAPQAEEVWGLFFAEFRYYMKCFTNNFFVASVVSINARINLFCSF